MTADRTHADFGTKLRDARERRGVSLRQIANSTKISVTVLEALERNDISRLPGGIFSRAFVRSYASEVGLDPEATIQDFIAQFPHDSVNLGHGPSEQFDQNDVESDRRMTGTAMALIAISLPIAGVVLYFTMGAKRDTPSEPVTPATTQAAAQSPGVPPVSDAPAATIRTPTAGAPPPGTLPSTAPTPAAGAEQAPDRLTIRLSVVRPCYVSATVDGSNAFQRVLSPGAPQTIEVFREMVLTAGDASAVSMTVNGADVKPLGKADEVKTIRLNLTNYRDFLQIR